MFDNIYIFTKDYVSMCLNCKSCRTCVRKFKSKNTHLCFTACNSGYNSDLYPQLHNVNTQIAEQFNARIKKMKHHLPYMTREHFLKNVELYLWFHSRNCARQARYIVYGVVSRDTKGKKKGKLWHKMLSYVLPWCFIILKYLGCSTTADPDYTFMKTGWPSLSSIICI